MEDDGYVFPYCNSAVFAREAVEVVASGITSSEMAGLLVGNSIAFGIDTGTLLVSVDCDSVDGVVEISVCCCWGYSFLF